MVLFSIFSRTKPQPKPAAFCDIFSEPVTVTWSSSPPPPDVAMLDALCAYIEKHGSNIKPLGMDWFPQSDGSVAIEILDKPENDHVISLKDHWPRILAARQRWATAQLKAAMEKPRPTPTVPKGRKSAKGKR